MKDFTLVLLEPEAFLWRSIYYLFYLRKEFVYFHSLYFFPQGKSLDTGSWGPCWGSHSHAPIQERGRGSMHVPEAEILYSRLPLV